MDLLTFFALPIATIILAFVFEKIIRLPILTALTFYAIYLIVAFTAFDSTFLPFVIAYTVLAYISALIAEIIYTNCKYEGLICNCNNNSNDDLNINRTLLDDDITKIANRVANLLVNNNYNCRRRY